MIWRVTVAVWLRLPLVPVMVRVLVLVLALRAVWIVRVDVLVALAGLKLAVLPAGRPLMLRATLPVKPPVEVMVIV